MDDQLTPAIEPIVYPDSDGQPMSDNTRQARWIIYILQSFDLLYDDRPDRAGVKFNDADLMGHPWQIVVGPRGAAAGTVELKRRATGERHELSLEAAPAKIG